MFNKRIKCLNIQNVYITFHLTATLKNIKILHFKLLKAVSILAGSGQPKMTQQVSVRRAFLCVLCLGCALFLILLHQRWTWTPGQTIMSARNTKAEVAVEVTAAEVTTPESTAQVQKKIVNALVNVLIAAFRSLHYSLVSIAF